MLPKEKLPVPIWVWAFGALVITWFWFGHYIIDDHEAVLALGGLFGLIWAVVYARKRRGL